MLATSDPDLARALPCFHLEGPYISPEDGPRGAHPRGHVRPPDRDEFHRLQEAAGGRIRLVTLAPEHEGRWRSSRPWCDWASWWRIGHTAASPGANPRRRPCGSEAVRRTWATARTRCCRGTRTTSGSNWPRDELWASIITDGHHLPPAVIRCMLRVKTPARLC